MTPRPRSPLLELHAHRRGAERHVALAGELAVGSADALEEELRRIEADRPETIVLDLRGLRFLDGSGARALADADDRARRDGRRLNVVAGPGAVRRTLELLLLDRRLRLVDDPDEGSEPTAPHDAPADLRAIVAVTRAALDADGALAQVSPARLGGAPLEVALPDEFGAGGAGDAIILRLRGPDPLVIADTRRDAPELAEAFGIRALLAAQLPGPEAGDEPLGALVALFRTPRAPANGESQTLLALARLAGLTVANARTRSALSDALAAARDRAETDDLTGMPNRRALAGRLRAAAATARRSERPLVLLAIDLDGFKAVNDRGGHAAGDAMLRKVAGALLGSVRPGDTAARLGGDEFVVLLPETSVGEGARVAERLRAAIRALRHNGTPLTASVGLAVLAADWAPGDLLVAADEAAYEAKRLGGDRMVIASSGAGGPPLRAEG